MFLKDPNAVLDYGINWAAWLPDGDTISASNWNVPDGITKVSDSSSATATTIWLSGGTAGETYSITNSITTAEGRKEDRTIIIRVEER